MSSVAQRLSEAMKLSDMTTYAFQRQMEKRKVRGASYPSILSYLGRGKNPTVTPPFEFIEAAADELHVRPAWLAFGDGEMTEAEKFAIRMQSRKTVVDLPINRSTHSAFSKAFPAYERLHPMYQDTIWTVLLFLEQTVNEAETADPEGSGYEDDAEAKSVNAARMIGAALSAPFQIMGINPEDVKDLELHRYVETACSAMLFLFDQRKLRLSVTRQRNRRVRP